MKKILSLILCIFLLAVSVCSVVSCGGDGGNDDGSDSFVYLEYEGEVTPYVKGAYLLPTDGCNHTDREIYTYRACLDIGDGISLNPLSADSATEEYLLSLIATPLYSIELNSDMKPEVKCGFAESLPRDVTHEYHGRFGIAEGESGRAFRIDLSKNASFALRNITAADYVYSFKSLLDPLMKYSAASELCSGEFAVFGAREYLNGEGEWESVGIVESSDYSIDIITEARVELPELVIPYNLSRPILVDRDVYEKSLYYFDKNGNVLYGHDASAVRADCSYGESEDFCVSYGPYRVSEYRIGKFMRLERNTAWYRNATAGTYQTDVVELSLNYPVTTDQLLRGEYEIVPAQDGDLVDYAASQRLVSSITDKHGILTFRTKGEDCAASLLNVKEMRLAVSAAITLANGELSASMADPSFGEVMDISYVRLLLDKAYIAAIDAGIYDGEAVALTMTVFGGQTELLQLLPSVIERAARNTSFEGLLALELCDGATELPTGNEDMSFVTLHTLSVGEHISSEPISSCFDPSKQRVVLSFGDEKHTAPLSEWLKWMVGGTSIFSLGPRDALSPEIREGFDRAILTAYSHTLAERFVYFHTSTYLVSLRLHGDAARIVGDAGLHDLKYLTYRYNDEQWKRIAPTVSYK